MAIPSIITNGAYVRLIWSLGGELALNVIGARVLPSTTINQALAESLGSAIKSAFGLGYNAACPTTTQLVRVGIRDMRVEHQPEFRDTGAAVTGTTALDQLPNGVAMCITLRTAGAGKSFRGRMYLSGFDENSNVAGLINVGTADTAITFVTAIRTAFSNNGLAMAVASRPAERFETVKTTFHADGSTTSQVVAKGAARTSTITDVVSVESRNTRWEHQRRRDNGRGTAVISALSPQAIRFFDVA